MIARIASAAIFLLPLVLSAAAQPPLPNPKTDEMLVKLGYRADYRGDLIDLRLEHRRIRREALEDAGVLYDEEGLLSDVHGAPLTTDELALRLELLAAEVAWAPERFRMDPELSMHLRRHGFTHDERGDILHVRSGSMLMRDALAKSGLDFDAGGRLAYRTREAGRPVETENIVPALRSRLDFTGVSRLDADGVKDMVGNGWENPPDTDFVAGSAFANGIAQYGEDLDTKIATLNALEKQYAHKAMEFKEVPLPASIVSPPPPWVAPLSKKQQIAVLNALPLGEALGRKRPRKTQADSELRDALSSPDVDADPELEALLYKPIAPPEKHAAPETPVPAALVLPHVKDAAGGFNPLSLGERFGDFLCRYALSKHCRQRASY